MHAHSRAYEASQNTAETQVGDKPSRASPLSFEESSGPVSMCHPISHISVNLTIVHAQTAAPGSAP